MTITEHGNDVGALATAPFLDAITELRRRTGGGDLLAVLCVAVDGFAGLHEDRGDVVADAALRTTVEHLHSCAPGAAIGRVGADVLAVAFLGDDDVARFLSLEVGRPVRVDVADEQITITLSSGLAFDNPAHEPVETLRRAEGRLDAHRRPAPPATRPAAARPAR